MALFFRREPEPEAATARDLAQRIGIKADELNEHFQSYQRSRDPFAAMLADIYNREQMARLYKSNRQ